MRLRSTLMPDEVVKSWFSPARSWRASFASKEKQQRTQQTEYQDQSKWNCKVTNSESQPMQPFRLGSLNHIRVAQRPPKLPKDCGIAQALTLQRPVNSPFVKAKERPDNVHKCDHRETHISGGQSLRTFDRLSSMPKRVPTMAAKSTPKASARIRVIRVLRPWTVPPVSDKGNFHGQNGTNQPDEIPSEMPKLSPIRSGCPAPWLTPGSHTSTSV
jgi:hypothetical protein